MADQSIDISGLSKAEVMAALYNGASAVGRGFLEAEATPWEMTVEDAQQYLSRTSSFDFLNGRSFKVDLSSDSFNAWLYDRDNGGDGTAELIIERLRDTGAVDSEESRTHRETMTAQHAFESPANAELGSKIGMAVAEVSAMWEEIVAAGIDEPREEMSPREHLDWSSDQALDYYDSGEPYKAILLFLALVSANQNTAWIATHTMTPMLLKLGIRGGRSDMERMMKDFNV